MALIKLTQNKKSIIDDSLFKELSKVRWYAAYAKNNRRFYAVRNQSRKDNNGRQRCEYLSWRVLGKPLKGFVVDHINGNTLDNRRGNLRIVTIAENNQNRTVHRKGKLLGTSIHKKTGLWRARICINSKHKTIGYFKTELQAHRAYLEFLYQS